MAHKVTKDLLFFCPSISLKMTHPSQNVSKNVFGIFCLLVVFTSALIGGISPADALGKGISRETIKRVKSATVYIEVRSQSIGTGRKRFLRSSGTGFVVDKEGLILTNAHVVAPVKYKNLRDPELPMKDTKTRDLGVFVRTSVTVRFRSGLENSKVYMAQVVASKWDKKNDVALLRIQPDEQLTQLSLLDPDKKQNRLSEQDEVWAFGFPLGSKLAKKSGNSHGPDISIREGRIDSLRHGKYGELTKIGHTVLIEHGNSGGPLVDSQGRVVGINTWGYGQHSAHALPCKLIYRAFGTLFWWRLWDDLGYMKNRKLLKVNPNGSQAYRTLAAAMKKARGGDTIVLSPGRHIVDTHVDFRDTVHIRGAGIGKTTLITKVAFPGIQSAVHGRIGITGWKYRGKNYAVIDEDARERHGIEISNMTIESNFTSALFLHRCNDWSLHDLEVIQKSKFKNAIQIGRSKVSITNCRCKLSQVSKSGRGILILNGSSVHLQNVQAESLHITRQSTLTAKGCRFNGQFATRKSLSRRKIKQYHEPTDKLLGWHQTVFIDDAKDVEFEGCSFDQTTLKSNGQYTRVQIKGRCHIQARGNCNLKLNGNYFKWDMKDGSGGYFGSSGGAVNVEDVYTLWAMQNTFHTLNVIPHIKRFTTVTGYTFKTDRTVYGIALQMKFKSAADGYRIVTGNRLINSKNSTSHNHSLPEGEFDRLLKRYRILEKLESKNNSFETTLKKTKK